MYKSLLACLLFLLEPALAATQVSERKAEGIPGSILFSNSVYYGQKLSPSGEYLLFRYWTTDGIVVIIYDIPEKTIKYNYKLPTGYNAQDLDWISDTALAFEHRGALIRMEANGSNMSVMIQLQFDESGSREDRKYKSWNFLRTLDNDRANILVESNSDKKSLIHKYNIFTGEKEDLADGRKLNINSWMTDQNGNPRLGIRKSKKKHQYFWYDSEKEILNPVVLPDRSELVRDLHNPLNNHYRFEGLTTNTRNIYISENKTTGYFRFLEINPVDGSIVKVLLDKPGYDFSSDGNDMYLFSHPKTGELVGIQQWGDSYSQEWLSPEFKTLQKKIDAHSPDTINLLRNCNSDLKYCRVTSLNFSDTFEQRVYDAVKDELTLVFPWAPERKDYQVSTPEHVTFQNQNSRISAYLTPPSNSTLSNTPVVIIPCPGPFERHYLGFNNYTQYFSTRGYAVLQVNTRGCTGYGEEHRLGKNGMLAKEAAADLARASVWLREQISYKQSKIFLFSDDNYGSYSISMGLKQFPDEFDAASLFGAPLETKAFYKYCKKDNYYVDLGYWHSQTTTGKLTKQQHTELSTYEAVANTSTPVLYASGDEDESPTSKTLEKLEKAAKSNQLLTVKRLKNTRLSLRQDSMQTYYADTAHQLFQKAMSGQD